MRIISSVILSIVVGSAIGIGASAVKTIGYDEGFLAGLESGLKDGERKGKEARTLELAKVFAPYGYQKIKAAKTQCEVKSGMECKIYGGFTPNIVVKKEPDTTKKGPY